MADGPTGPDFGAMLSLINASRGPGGGSGVAPILMGCRLEENVGAGLSLQGKGLNADGMVNKLPQSRPGPVANFLRSIGFSGSEILDGMRKVAQAGAVREASITDITGQSHGLGRSLPGGSDIGIG